MDGTQNATKIDSAHDQAEMDGIQNATNIDSTNNQAEMDGTQNATNIDNTNNQAEIDGTQNATNIDTTKDQAEMDGTQNATNIDTTNNQAEMDGTQNAANIDSTHDNSEMDCTQNATNIDSIHDQAEMNGTQTATNIDSTNNQTEMDGTQNATNIDTTNNQTEMDGTQNATNIGSTHDQAEIDSTHDIADMDGTQNATNIDSTHDQAEIEVTHNRADPSDSEDSLIINRQRKKRKQIILDSDSDYEIIESKKGKVSADEIVIPGSDSDGKSDVYPMLNRKIESLSQNISTDEDEENHGNVARDCNNRNIYVKMVEKSLTTKCGKMKKHTRVYNVMHPCPFCTKSVANFSKHISTTAHKSEPLVKEILETTDPKDRKDKIQVLRLKGIHTHNMKVLESGKGELILRRRSMTAHNLSDDSDSESEDENDEGKTIDISKYGPCPQCYGWILITSLKRHMKKCCKQSNVPVDSISNGTLTVQSDILAGRIPAKASKALIEEVFPIMLNDEVCKVAKDDALILNLGNQWMLRNMGNTIMRKYYTSTVMRLAAKLKMAIQALDGTQHSLEFYFCPKYFETIIKAALRCSLSDGADDDDLKSPSNAIKLGYDIKRMVSAKLANALISGNAEMKEDSEQFLQLMAIDWGLKVTKLARTILKDRSFYQEKNLPLPDDVKKLANFMKAKLQDLDLEDLSWSNFKYAAMISLARVTLFNRRRCHEVQAMKISAYNMRKQGSDEFTTALRGDLTPFESNLLLRQEVVVVRGKTGKGVPVIIPEDCMEVLKFLVCRNVRKQVGVPCCNNYVFGCNGAGVFRAYDAIRTVALSAGLHHPNRIRTSNMRKYMATMLQALNTNDAERQWVLDHLGHTMNVHQIHYRQTSDILERVDVAKILLLQDMGLVGKYRGKTLDDIQLDELMPTSEEVDTLPSEATEVKEILGDDGIHDDDYVPMADYHCDGSDDESYAEMSRKPKKKKMPSTRQKWTSEEVQELETLFKLDFENDKCPSQKRVESAIRVSKANGGVICKRNRDTIKKKVSNMMIKNRQKNVFE